MASTQESRQEELSKLALQDSTVYTYRKMQRALGWSDEETLERLVLQLAKEKQYFQDEMSRAASMTVRPLLIKNVVVKA